MCLDANNGKELWKNKYQAKAVTGPAASHPGPRSTPTVQDGKVVTFGASGVLSCVDASSGKEIWRKDELSDVLPQFFTAMSPLIVDGICIAHLGGQDKGVLIAYELASGNPKWKWEGEGPSYSSPVVMTVEGTKLLVILTEKSIAGVSLDKGKIVWQVATPVQKRYWNSVTPVIDGSSIIYTGQGDGTKSIKIEKQGDTFTPKELWNSKDLGTVYNTPVLKDGLLYGVSPNGNFFCLNAKTGQSLWISKDRSDNFCSLIEAGGVFLALPANKPELIVFKPSDKDYEELARIKAADTPVYAYPVIFGKQIIVKDKETVTSWSLE